MSSATPAGRGSPALVALTGLLVAAEAGLAAVGLLVANAYRRDDLTGAEAATFVLLGASAAVGALVLLLAAIGFARGGSGHGTARGAAVLARLRAGAVLVALVVIALRLGGSALAGLLETTGALVAVADALVALWVTGVAVRRTRHG